MRLVKRHATVMVTRFEIFSQFSDDHKIFYSHFSTINFCEILYELFFKPTVFIIFVICNGVKFNFSLINTGEH